MVYSYTKFTPLPGSVLGTNQNAKLGKLPQYATLQSTPSPNFQHRSRICRLDQLCLPLSPIHRPLMTADFSQTSERSTF